MDQIPDLPSSFEHAACGLVTADENGVILRVNATLLKWLDFSPDELVGVKKIQELFTVGGRFFHHTHLAPLLQLQGSIAEIQIDLVCRNGIILPVLINVSRQKHNNKHFDQFAVFVATERKNFERELISARKELHELNEQLSLADRRKDEFLATLAHELRNPLAPMQNVLEIMRHKGERDHFIAWSCEMISRHVSQMTHLVDDLMESTRISQGRLSLRKKRIDLLGLIQNSIETAHALMQASEHVFTVETAESPIFIDADSTRIIQIISNLLTNAAKYTPTGGRIVLRAFVEQDEAVISVKDTGIGIPTDQLSNIFSMFSQLAPALERAQGGLGIGLALVQGLVKLHEGTIVALSEGEGKGSEFIVRLPLSGLSQADSENIITANMNPTESKRILVIDDNIDGAESLSLVLQLNGHVTGIAHNGYEGLKIAEEFKPDVILLDIGLPDINGYEVARQIRKTSWGGEVLLIAATGWGQEKDKELAIDAGFDKHLTKPINFQYLNEMLISQANPAT